MKRIPFWPYLNNLQKASLVTALLGFVISFTTTVSSGGVTVHRNWAALAFGVLTLLLGLASVPESLRSTEHRSEKLIAFVVAILIGALHLARGLGVFYGGGGEPRIPTPILPRRTPIATAPPITTPTPIASPTPSASEHMDLGLEYYGQGKFDEAIAEFQAAIELEPDDADAHRNLGTAYGEQGKWEEAAAAYEQAIELDPDFGEAYGDLVWPYIELGRLSEAIATGEKAIELTPDYAAAHNNLGVAYDKQGRLEEAIAEYQEATRLDPDDALAHNNLGIAYKKQGRLDEAIAEYQEAIRLDPDYATAHNNLGNAYADQGQLDEAIAEYKEAIRLNPNSASAHFNLGNAYYHQGRLDEAIAKWEAITQIDPNHADAHKNLGVAYNEQGRAEEAIVEFETYLQLRPDAPDRKAVEEEIAKLKESAEYRHPVGGYSLRYPDGWYYAESETQVLFAESEEALEVIGKEAPGVIFHAAPLTEIAESLGLTEITDPAETLEAIAKKLKMETGEIETGQVAGYPAALTDISGTFEDVPHKGGLVVCLVEERVVYGVALVPPDQWDAFRPIFIAMVNSLSFFEP
ncbi:MAG: tetratricopeptide repeat protein [Anaerolineae bacterium]|nr:tetratricopeptide repeat protein [Anaerolineae bacterium]